MVIRSCKLSMEELEEYTGSLQNAFYGPAQELGILPGVIDTVLHRYFKYNSKEALSSKYKGCIHELNQELGVDELAEKITFDWIHLSRSLERFSANSDWSLTAHYEGMLKITRQMLPRTHPTRYLMEYTSQPCATVEPQDVPDWSRQLD